MDLGAAGLREQPFPSHGKPPAVLSYGAHAEALETLKDTYEHPTGLCLLQGPTLSGKSTLIRCFIDTLHEDCAVALVDGRGLNTTNLLTGVLHQFGYTLETTSNNELLGLVRVFALQQAGSHEPPLLIIENMHEMNPSGLRALCELAELRVNTGSALKIVLVSDRSLTTLMKAPAMQSLSERLLHELHLHPMTQQEAKGYLHDKLRVAGSDYPDFVFPDAVCAELWKASGGWPGILDRLALLALARAQTLPVAVAEVEHPTLPTGTWDEEEVSLAESGPAVPPESPQLIVTNKGSTIGNLRMEKPRMLVGRSDHNDISIGSRFISRHHALLVRHGSSTFLMDLNSTNGTFVNGRRVSNHVLLHDDVITLGHHKIKFNDPYATTRGRLDGAEFADTAIMKTLEDMRNLLARENTALLPVASEDLPTIQT
ncbi:MAG: FHA domain-containing protein [Gammaproteobacteria bacterium]|nr:FHA domain-containing protein [Gammaproteobacteria bacterium]